MNQVIANSNIILNELFETSLSENFTIIYKRHNLKIELLNKIDPEYVFFPHWSCKIPEEIFGKHECIVFHMTDLPFGRGGSPLQNLIKKGFSNTKISAIRVINELDAGPVYMKCDLSLFGTAEEIFLRAGKIIIGMIKEIIISKPQPIPQQGELSIFKRRNPEMSDLSDVKEIEKCFDHIRMLDTEGYPKAYIENEYFKFEFSRASLKANKSIIADVRIIKK